MMKITNPVKRKLIQIATFGFSNMHISNFPKGELYKGHWKSFCNPGLNCYSCPAAGFACPIGAMQAVSSSYEFQFSFYVVGFLLAVGVLFGRAICGFICPFGLIQELLHKLPFPKWKIWKGFRYVKYFILIIFVGILPIAYTNYMEIGKPAFCQFICPAGMIEGALPLLITNGQLRQAIGSLFFLKLTILVITILACMAIYRFFCKTMCPLGAIYGLLNKISMYHLEVDKNKCVGCGQCADVCKMDVDPVKQPNSAECIRCGECAANCPSQAIKIGFSCYSKHSLKRTTKKQ